MAAFAQKSPEEHRRFARTIEGNLQANVALACGLGSWVVAAPVLAVFAIVFGIRASLRVRSLKALAGVILGALSLTIVVWHFLKPYLQ